jgi:hypothetical protein
MLKKKVCIKKIKLIYLWIDIFLVVKFKKRQRYLEFFVQVAQKALTEGLYSQVVDWCEETTNALTR